MMDVSVNYNQALQGIELVFADKPAEEVREQLKANGFRWSRNQGLWYARDTAERREFVGTLTDAEPTEEAAPLSFPEIDIDDLDSYRVSPELSKRENDSSWIFRTHEHNHTDEIQGLFREKNERVKKLLEGVEDEQLIYRIKSALQRYKRQYFKNYVAQLTHKANNPSWAVTGRSGRNARRDEKASNRFDNLMRESIEISKEFDRAMYTLGNLSGHAKTVKTREKAENMSLDNITFTVGREAVTVVGVTNTVRTYRTGDYMICKTFACFRIFKNGKEIHSMRTTDTLVSAKKYVCMLIEKDKQRVEV